MALCGNLLRHAFATDGRDFGNLIAILFLYLASMCSGPVGSHPRPGSSEHHASTCLRIDRNLNTCDINCLFSKLSDLGLDLLHLLLFSQLPALVFQ